MLGTEPCALEYHSAWLRDQRSREDD
uniref:Uncharacterized protein n=1 Tax=Rhizophora mucronata TaxID=61149 RepID=A0A2P2J4W4_RHIMU